MRKKHWIAFQDHAKCIHNDIVKPLRVGIPQYAKRVCEMHDLENYLYPPSMKVMSFESASWEVCDKDISKHVILVADKDGLPTSIQGELEDNHEDNCSILHE